MQVKKQQLELDMEQQTGSKSGKESVSQGCILSPCLFNLYAEYIMRNAGMDEAQAGIKIAGLSVFILENWSHFPGLLGDKQFWIIEWAFYFLKTSIYLAAPGLSCGMWDLVYWLGIEPQALCIGILQS